MVSEIDWNRLYSFVGYGPRSTPKVLFLGLEEKTVDGDKTFHARSSFEAIEDLFEAHQNKLEPAGCSNPFADERRNPVRQWNIAAKFALALDGEPCWSEKDKWRRYWRNQLGRRNGTTFLMECFPIPRKYRGAPIDGYPNYSDEEAWCKRREVLARYFTSHRPATIICYGKATKEKIEDLLQIDEGMWDDVNGVTHRASVVRVGSSRVAHVGFFGQGKFESRDIPTIVEALNALKS